MNEQRNPFLFRASEHIEADSTFVRFFSPAALDVIKDINPLTPRLLLSAPGAGKTSLMRLFTPGALWELHKHRDVKDYQDLYRRMQVFGAISDDGPVLLGVLVSCYRGYASLADLGLDAVKERRLFFALLDTRLLLAVVRELMILKRLNNTSDLDRVTLSDKAGSQFGDLKLPATGKEIFQWAKKREEAICSVLDSFEPSEIQIPGSDSLTILDLLRSDSLLVDGQPAFSKVLVMLDDIQQLTAAQRAQLTTHVLEKRSPVPVWIAQRLEALEPTQLLNMGNIEGRDYELVHMESFWREHSKKHEAMVGSIGDRRVKASKAVDLYELGPNLEDTLDGGEWEKVWMEAIAVVSKRVRLMAQNRPEFVAWLEERKRPGTSLKSTAVAWRELEILIERQLRKRQLSFDFEELPVDILEDKSDGALRSAAELFLSHEFKVPYYFGSSTLAKLCSFNVQQYLGLAAPQFEEIISANLINPRDAPILSAARQEVLLSKASYEMWHEISRRTGSGVEVRALLESIALFSRDYTYRPNAPNDPGVNGVAISMAERSHLMDTRWLRHRPEHQSLSRAISSAVAQNLIDTQLNYRCKGQTWMILNLNRLLCVKFRLPLNYGRFKEQSLDTLAKWMSKPFEPARNQKGNLL